MRNFILSTATNVAAAVILIACAFLFDSWTTVVLGFLIGVIATGLSCRFVALERPAWVPEWLTGHDSKHGNADLVRDAGVVRIFRDFEDARGEIARAVATARHRVDLVGVSFTLSHNHEFEQALRTFLGQPHARLFVYFLDPNSPAVEARARIESRPADQIRAKIRGGVDVFEEIVRGQGWDDRVELRFHQLGANLRLRAIDAIPAQSRQSKAFVAGYRESRDGTVPTVELWATENPNGLFAATHLLLQELEANTVRV